MSTAQLLFLISTISLFVVMLISLATTLHAAMTALDETLEKMTAASNFRIWSPLLYGLKGKFYMVAQLCGLIIFQKRFIKIGAITIEEIESIPDKFKRKLTILFWMDVFICCFAAILVGTIKLGWVK